MTTSEQETVSSRARPGRTADSNEPDASASPDGRENITQIREILFGRQMEEYDGRFSRIEDRITSVASTIQAEFIERLTQLETSVQRQLKALEKDLRSEHQKGSAGIEKKLETARSNLQSGVDDVRDELASQVQSLRDALDREHDLVTEKIDTEAADVRDKKVDRTALAALLKEVASQLDSA